MEIYLSPKDNESGANLRQFLSFRDSPDTIPKEWESYGRTIIFSGTRVRNEHSGRGYVLAMTFIKTLVFDSRIPDVEWVFHRVLLDEQGKVPNHFGKDDISYFCRYAFREDKT